jgi:hypothetical protein
MTGNLTVRRAARKANVAGSEQLGIAGNSSAWRADGGSRGGVDQTVEVGFEPAESWIEAS